MKTAVKLTIEDIQAAVAAYVKPKFPGVKAKNVELSSIGETIVAEVEIDLGQLGAPAEPEA